LQWVLQEQVRLSGSGIWCGTFERESVQRLVISRPILEAGEKIGFLPGDIYQKVDPFFRPLYDALFDLLGPEKTQRYIEEAY